MMLLSNVILENEGVEINLYDEEDPMPQKKIDEVMEQYRNRMFEYYKSEAWLDFIGYPLSWNDEFKQALASHLLGLPSLQPLPDIRISDPDKLDYGAFTPHPHNEVIEPIRKELAEALGVSDATPR